jgi:hypothetical protein
MHRKTRNAIMGAATAAVVAVGGVGIASAHGNQPGQAHERGASNAEHEARHDAKQKVIADTLAMEWAAIQARLLAGETLADIAGDKKAALIEALVAHEQAELTQRVTEMVEGTHRGLGMKRGHRGFGPGPLGTPPASSSSAPGIGG